MQRYNIELKPPKTKMENTLLSIFYFGYKSLSIQANEICLVSLAICCYLYHLSFIRFSLQFQF